MEIFARSIKKIVLAIIKLYKIFISPILPPSCRHTPSCSDYCVDAIEKHGLLKGLALSTNRLLRCRPGGTSGYDPVPEENKK